MSQKINIVVPDQKTYDSYCSGFDYNNKKLKSYMIDFSNDELNNETWECLANIDVKYKECKCMHDSEKLLYDLDNYYISNLGRICKKVNDQYILRNVITNSLGYKHINISKIRYRINRLMGFVYLKNIDPDNMIEVNHNDEITCNNRINNLKWMTPKSNSNYGTGKERASFTKSKVQTGKKQPKEVIEKINSKRDKSIQAALKVSQRKVIMTNIITDEEIIYISISEAARQNNCSYETIRQHCINNTTFKKIYKFKYADGNGPKKRIKGIVQLTYDNQIVKIYKDMHEVSQAGFDTTNVNRCCKSKGINKLTEAKGLKFSAGGYKWRYLDDFNLERKQNQLPPLTL